MAEGIGRAHMDQLSELPDGVLREILALLPLQELVRTAVLSRRWRHLWPTTPVLDLSSVPEHLRVDSYYHVLHRCYNVPGALRVLSVVINNSFPDPSTLARIFTAFAELRSVDDLALYGCYVHGVSFTIFTVVPQSLYLCRTLRCLFLYNVTVGTVPISALFPFLSRIFISNAILIAQDAAALLAACPRIESFTIVGCVPLGHLVVCSPTLRCLHLLERSCCSPTMLSLELVHAPELRSISLHGDLNVIKLFKDCKKLLNVTAFGEPLQCLENHQQWLNFVDGIKCARSLSVNHWFLQLITSETPSSDASMLDNIKEFHLCSERFTMENLLNLLLFLKNSPPKQFYLHRDHWAGTCGTSIPEGDDLSEDDFWELMQKKCHLWKRDKPDDVSDKSKVDSDDYCDGSMCGLVKFTITGFSGTMEEMLFVKIMIEYAKHLRFVFLYCASEIEEERLEEISMEVRSFRGVTSDLQVWISEHPPSSVCQACDRWKIKRVMDD